MILSAAVQAQASSVIDRIPLQIQSALEDVIEQIPLEIIPWNTRKPAAETQPEESIPVIYETIPVIYETIPVIEETIALETDLASTLNSAYPHYFQEDYPDVRYGNGTIATSGCGITSLAMVATYMTGYTYLPNELANYFGGHTANNNTERMLYAADQLQLPWHQAENWHECEAALKKGCPVIILENWRSKFTNTQHYIVATGLTEKGRVLVLDSARSNYTKWDLKQGFEKGFTQLEICAGYSGAWIFDINAMPENPFIYVEEQKAYVEPRYPDLELAQEDVELLAKLLWAEARGETNEGQQAVAEVILNRLVHPDFPDTMDGVVYAEDQFQGTKYIPQAKPTQTQYEAIEDALYGPYILPLEVVHFATFAATNKVWGEIGGHVFCYQAD